MMKHRIRCLKCGWATKPKNSLVECLGEKEKAHARKGLILAPDKTPNDAALSNYCPRCGGRTVEDCREKF